MNTGLLNNTGNDDIDDVAAAVDDLAAGDLAAAIAVESELARVVAAGAAGRRRSSAWNDQVVPRDREAAEAAIV